jgi:probable rRNA maturation factor
MIVEVRNRQRAHRINVARLKKLAAGFNSKFAALSIVLVNDAEMARLNLQYHHTRGPTDILTFDYGEGQGELVISVERAVAQARRFRTTLARELALYVVHGLLHLHGHDDRTPRQRARMRAAERRWLNRLSRYGHLTTLVKR